MSAVSSATQRVTSELTREHARTLRVRGISLRFTPRPWQLAALAGCVIFFGGVFVITQGEVPLEYGDALRAVFGQGSLKAQFVVQELRLPRILLAVLVGIALAVSGALFQAVVRNPLVSPDVIGVNTGAAGVGFVWILITRNAIALPLVMFLGALAATALIYLLSWKGGINPQRLVLIGIGLQTLTVAVESFMVRRFPIEDVIWADNMLLGSLASASWEKVTLNAPAIAVLLVAGLLISPRLRVMQLGDDVARSVGLSAEGLRLMAIVIGCALAGLAVSAAGLIGFVALMVPHIARMIAGPLSAGVLMLAALLGGALVLVADYVGNQLMPTSLPVSVVIGALGAPYFLFIFWRSQVRL